MGFTMEHAALDLPEILSRLTLNSRRPRYTMMVLALLSEAADAKGQAGPFVTQGSETMPVRLWLGGTLAQMSARHGRRAAMRERVAATMVETTPDSEEEASRAPETIDDIVERRAREVCGANVSRAITDLVKCGLVRREYVGHWTRHPRKGGQRHASYIVSQDALAALRRGTKLI
jgi:hypothetical protein